MHYELSRLSSGLRLVTVPLPSAYSASVRVTLAAGSRHEPPALAGAAHFIEHMLFKGTGRRPTPRQIAIAIEGVGGDLNASTGRELTTYYARVSAGDLDIALDVLMDMLLESRFAPEDIERERKVIIEEINESLDLPDEVAAMNFQELLWPDHPLGRDVAGSRSSVRRIDRSALLDYFRQSYQPERVVLSVAGNVTHEQVAAQIERLSAGWRGGDALPLLAARQLDGPLTRAAHRPVEQCHLLLGCRAVDWFSPDRFALTLLDIILGEGMSSRLFTRIREERGLAYSIYSYSSHLQDSGSFAVCAGVDESDLDETIHAVLEELHRLREEPVAEEELAMAKAYIRGRTHLQLEDTGTNASWVGQQLAVIGQVVTPSTLLAQLDAVTAADIQRLARTLFRDEALALSVVGPVDENRDWVALLKVE